MFDTNGSEFLAVILTLSAVVFFGVTAWINLAREVPAWTRTALGISALVIAFCALLALF